MIYNYIYHITDWLICFIIYHVKFYKKENLMNFRATNFVLMALLSSTSFGMIPPEKPENKISLTYGERVNVGELHTELSALSAADDFLADQELKALFKSNIQEQGLVFNIFHQACCLLKHHNEMIELLEKPKEGPSIMVPTGMDVFFEWINSLMASLLGSPKIDPLITVPAGMDDFLGWVNSLHAYTQMNGIPKLAIYSSDDLKELQKGKAKSHDERAYVTFLIQSLNRQQASSNNQCDFSLSPEVIKNIFKTAKTEAEQNALLNTLTQIIHMSRDCFLNIERKKASLYQNFIDDLSETLNQTVADNQDNIGTFLILRHLHHSLEAPFGKLLQFKMKATRESVEVSGGMIHDLHLTNHLLDAENDLSPFYAGFFKSNIASMELPRVLSLKPFTPKVSFNKETLRSDQPAPLKVGNESASHAKIQAIIKNYKDKFQEKRTKRNKEFTPTLMNQVLTLEYAKAKAALTRLNKAYLAFEQEKLALHHMHNQKILEACAKETGVLSADLSSTCLDSPMIEIGKESEYSVLVDSYTASSSSAGLVSADLAVEKREKISMFDATKETPTTRKENRWHTRTADLGSALDAKMPTEALAFDTTYYYTEQEEWPDWISELKRNKHPDMLSVLKGFARDASEGGLKGIVIEGDNKYFITFASPFSTDILPTNRTYRAKAHALNKGKTEMRYPALREVLIDMLEEAHIIRK